MRVDRISCLILAIGLAVAAAILRYFPQGEVRTSRLVIVDSSGQERFVIAPSYLEATDSFGNSLLAWSSVGAHIGSPFDPTRIELRFERAENSVSGRHSGRAHWEPGRAQLVVLNHVGRPLMQATQWPQHLDVQFNQYSWPPPLLQPSGEPLLGKRDWTKIRRQGYLRLDYESGELGWEWRRGPDMNDIVREALDSSDKDDR